jgi:CRP/FNR family cyclic AMP-dependent transcriptional regulator
MNKEEQVELLCGVDIFEDLPKEEVREVLDDLLERHAEIDLGAGEVFYTPRDPDGRLFILKQGEVRIYKMERSREFTLEVVDAGTVFGEVAFTDHRLRDAYAQATEPSILLAMEREDVERLILQKPKVGLRLVSLLSERLRYYETRIEDVTLKGVPARLASLILFLIQSEGVQVPGEIRIPTRYTHEHLGTAAAQATHHLRRRRRSPRESGRAAFGGRSRREPLLVGGAPCSQGFSLLSTSRSAWALCLAAVASTRSTSRSSTTSSRSRRAASLDHKSMWKSISSQQETCPSSLASRACLSQRRRPSTFSLAAFAHGVPPNKW